MITRLALERHAWTAQTVHQAHHGQSSGTWENCDSVVCRESQKLARELKGEISVPEALFGPVSQPETIELLYLVFIITDDGRPALYVHDFDEYDAVDRAKSINGIVVAVPILHDYRRKTGESNG